jgi:predicted nucleotide-binding protein
MGTMAEPREFKFLPISVQLATAGGLAAPLLRRGTPLPTERVERLTTTTDGQTAAEFAVLLGESQLAAKNASLGRVGLANIPSAKKGERFIRLTLSLDRHCVVHLRAEVEDKGPSVEETFRIFDVLTEASLADLVAIAASARVDDDETAERIRVRLDAENLLVRADADIRDRRAAGTLAQTAEPVEKAIAALGIALASDDTSQIGPLMDSLEKRIGEADAARAAGLDNILADFFTATPTRRRHLQPQRSPIQPERVRPAETRAHSRSQSGSSDLAAPTTNSARVFVVHGRNENVRLDFFAFLRALGLQPIEWSEAIALTGKPTPYIGEILDAAFGHAQAIVVLLTPDDVVRLAPELWRDSDGATERDFLRQPRANVLFEAGMAAAHNMQRTVLIEVGTVKSFSDIAGRHVLRLNNTPERRTDVAERLRIAGCAVSTNGRDWLSIGAFAVEPTPSAPAS